METQDLLLLLLTIGYMVLLVLVAVFLVLMIRILLGLRRIARNAEEATATLSQSLKEASERASAMALAGTLIKAVKKLRRRRNKEGDNE
jgi:hypothetical protein